MHRLQVSGTPQTLARHKTGATRCENVSTIQSRLSACRQPLCTMFCGAVTNTNASLPPPPPRPHPAPRFSLLYPAVPCCTLLCPAVPCCPGWPWISRPHRGEVPPASIPGGYGRLGSGPGLARQVAQSARQGNYQQLDCLQNIQPHGVETSGRTFAMFPERAKFTKSPQTKKIAPWSSR